MIHYYQTYLLGVVQLLNKLDGTSFNRNDQNLFEVFLTEKVLLTTTYVFQDFEEISDLSFSSCRDYCSNV